jgi:hypothetical protein
VVVRPADPPARRLPTPVWMHVLSRWIAVKGQGRT